MEKIVFYGSILLIISFQGIEEMKASNPFDWQPYERQAVDPELEKSDVSSQSQEERPNEMNDHLKMRHFIK